MLGPLPPGSDMAYLRSGYSEDVSEHLLGLVACSDQFDLVGRQFGGAASADVHGRRRGFKVRGSDTPPLPAEVVKLQTLRNRSDLLLVHRAVSEVAVASPSCHPIRVPRVIGTSTTDPNPARRLVTSVFNRVVGPTDRTSCVATKSCVALGVARATGLGRLAATAFAKTCHQATSLLGWSNYLNPTGLYKEV